MLSYVKYYWHGFCKDNFPLVMSNIIGMVFARGHFDNDFQFQFDFDNDFQFQFDFDNDYQFHF